jgi:phosphoserine phosphatase
VEQPTAIFDFDRTLTREDSFKRLLRDCVRLDPWRALLIISGLPLIIITLILRIDRRYAKSWMLWSCTVGLSPFIAFERLRRMGAEAATELLLHQGCQRLKDLHADGVRVIICTASAAEWVEGYVSQASLPVDLIVGSRLGYRFGGIIMSSANCYAEEKTKRLLPYVTDSSVTEGYSDHPSDAPLLNLAQKAYLISPKRHHKRKFETLLQVPHSVLHWNG